jgi:uncharacterized protein
MRQKLTLVTLGVANLKRSIDFYEVGLGWKRSSSSQDDLAIFDLGGIILGLYSRERLCEDAGISAEGSGFSGIALTYNAIDEHEVNHVTRQAESLGATVVKQPQKAFWGGYNSYFRDLDGHLFEVAFNPFWPLDDGGSVVLPEPKSRRL